MRHLNILTICTSLLFIKMSNVHSQNLVENGSFEIISSCPSGQSATEISKATGWIIPFGNVMGSPDLFNECSNNFSNKVPNNIFTYQYANTGKGYAGFFTFRPDKNNIREYICYELPCNLIAGKRYYVGFYMNYVNKFVWASNSVGLWLNHERPWSDSQVIDVDPQVEYYGSTAFTDTLSWKLVSDTIVATGNERWVVLGNFKTDSELITEVFNINDDSNGAYYIVDDVFVIDLEANENNISQVDILPSDTTVCPNEVMSININDFSGSYTWSNGSSGNYIEAETPGTYTVLVKRDDCYFSDTITISHYDGKDTLCEVIIEMPNIFTPNEDGINDFYLPVSVRNIEFFEILIFDRWGNKLFTITNENEYWNGKFKNLNCPEGVYFWSIKATDRFNQPYFNNGSFQLVK